MDFAQFCSLLRGVSFNTVQSNGSLPDICRVQALVVLTSQPLSRGKESASAADTYDPPKADAL